MDQNGISELSVRLNNLERQNRRLRTGLAALVVGGAAVLTVGAALPEKEPADGSFDQLHIRQLVIADDDGRKRVVLELESGEPALKMFNHEGHRQVFLGIDERWEDTAYLSVSSRLENGDVDKQAVLAATTGHADSGGNTQLVLYDARPRQKDAGRQHLLRLSSGQPGRKPFLEISESKEKGPGQVSYDLLQSELPHSSRRALLETDSDPATLTGVKVSGP